MNLDPDRRSNGVVLISDTFTETPEGQFRMDRVRRWDEALRGDLRRLLTPEMLAALDAEEEKFITGGGAP